ncbi:hypothetical protein [Streptomyces sp. NPDC055099]
MHDNHARKNAARQHREAAGGSYAASLAHIRADRLDHRDRVTSSEYTPPGTLSYDAPVPDELPNLVRHHVDTVNMYFREVLTQAHYARGYKDWARIVLYRLTDALEHMHLMIGTIAGHLQENHVTTETLRSYLQVRNDRDVQAFVTPRALEHLDGLVGRPLSDSDGMDINHRVGQCIAERRGWAEPDREDTLEAFLCALYSNYPYDSGAFDSLPEHIKSCALQAAALSLVKSVPEEDG